jgi:hypothetical protein
VKLVGAIGMCQWTKEKVKRACRLCATATSGQCHAVKVKVMVTVIVGPASRSRSPDQSPGKVFAILWLLLSLAYPVW